MPAAPVNSAAVILASSDSVDAAMYMSVCVEAVCRTLPYPRACSPSHAYHDYLPVNRRVGNIQPRFGHAFIGDPKDTAPVVPPPDSPLVAATDVMSPVPASDQAN